MRKLNLNNNKTLFSIINLLLIGLSISQILSISILNIIITILIVVIYLCLKIEQSFILTFALLPFFNFFTIKIGSTSLYYVFVLLFIFKYMKHKKFKIGKVKLLVLLLLFVDRFFSFDFIELSKWTVMFSFLVLSYNESFANRNIKNVIKYTTISYILASSFGYLMHINGMYIYTNSYVYSKESGATTRFAGLVGDSVFFGQFSAAMISANLVLAYYEKKHSSILKSYFAVILITMYTLLSYSKTGILLCALSILGYVIWLIVKNSKNKKTIIKSFIIMLVLVFGILLLIRYITLHTDNALIRNYITRFTAADLFTGRGEIANHYIMMLKSNLKHLFVAMNQLEYLTPFSPNGITMIDRAHNIYIETICCFGVIPSIVIFTWFFKKMFWFIVSGKNLINLMPIMVMLITGFVLHGHFESQYYFLISLSLLMITNVRENNKEIY